MKNKSSSLFLIPCLFIIVCCSTKVDQNPNPLQSSQTLSSDTLEEPFIKIDSSKSSLNPDEAEYMSPDLALFNLRGIVKSVTYSGPNFYILPLPYTKPIKFDEMGNWDNINSVLLSIYKGIYNKNNVLRDSIGQIIEINCTKISKGGKKLTLFEELDTTFLGYEWKNGVPQLSYVGGWEASAIDTIEYRDNLISKLKISASDQQHSWDYHLNFSNYVLDSHGNWTECKITISNSRGDVYYIKDIPELLKREIIYY